MTNTIKAIEVSRTISSSVASNPTSEPTRNIKKSREILMFFDSNGKHIDRKKLWKMNNSEFIRFGQLDNVATYLDKTDIDHSSYVLLSVGCNDLDEKDHKQVFAEMSNLLDKFREKFKNVKFIINEITPRNDDRDNEVKSFNGLLVHYARDHEDTTIAFQHNLRDPN